MKLLTYESIKSDLYYSCNWAITGYDYKNKCDIKEVWLIPKKPVEFIPLKCMITPHIEIKIVIDPTWPKDL